MKCDIKAIKEYNHLRHPYAPRLGIIATQSSTTAEKDNQTATAVKIAATH